MLVSYKEMCLKSSIKLTHSLRFTYSGTLAARAAEMTATESFISFYAVAISFGALCDTVHFIWVGGLAMR